MDFYNMLVHLVTGITPLELITILAILFLLSPGILLLLIRPALWCSDGKVWHRWLYMTPFVLAAWLLDILVAHTYWALVFGSPKPHEVTISHTLERLIHESEHRYWALAYGIACAIDRIAPGHIKTLVRVPD